MSPRVARVNKNENGFPRVSGDEPSRVIRVTVDASFSPRERG